MSPAGRDELAGARKAADVAELGGDGIREHPADPGHGHQQRHVVVVGAEPAQLTLALFDLPVELVDQTRARLDRPFPRLGQAETGEQLAAADAEQIGDEAGLPWVSSAAWTRCFRLERWRTRCSRQRARSRSARTRGSGSQIAGT
jgi:hypothetical protein